MTGWEYAAYFVSVPMLAWGAIAYLRWHDAREARRNGR